MSRRFVLAGLMLSGAVILLWRLLVWHHATQAGWMFVALAPLPIVVVLAVPCFAVAMLLARFRGGGAIRGAVRSAAATALFAAFVLAAPVSVQWDDGCNDHAGWVPVVVRPLVELRKPTDSKTAYSDVSTLMACPAEPFRLVGSR